MSTPPRSNTASERLAFMFVILSNERFSGLVAVDGVHREGGEADGYVFGAAFVGSGIADPLAGVGDYGLSGGYVEGAFFVFFVQRAFQDDGEFVEGGGLPGFEPSGGAAHAGYAGG